MMDKQRLLENVGQPEYIVEASDTTGKNINWIGMETEGYQGDQKIFLYANGVELAIYLRPTTSTSSRTMHPAIMCVPGKSRGYYVGNYWSFYRFRQE